MTITIRETSFPAYPVFIFASYMVGSLIVHLYLVYKKTPAYAVYGAIVLNIMITQLLGMSFPIIISKGTMIGLSGVGAAFGMVLSTLVCYFLIPRYRDNIIKANALAAPLMYSISKLSCLFAGCCHGFKYNGPFCLNYRFFSDHSPRTLVFPVQPLETIVFFLIFLIGLFLIRFCKADFFAATIGGLSAIAKFVLDFLRSAEYKSGTLSVNQYLCIGLYLGIIVYIIVKYAFIKKESVI
ncbi:MAG: prolipoprotein diacylglyceryl transferase [Pseudobutyrivibrio sp.]|nr:prolipoprotein diacylglyceryl transferase [Pseudobutyrivibrio sp.]